MACFDCRIVPGWGLVCSDVRTMPQPGTIRQTIGCDIFLFPPYRYFFIEGLRDVGMVQDFSLISLY